MDNQDFKGNKEVVFSKRYLSELREKWQKTQNEEARMKYYSAVEEYNKTLVLDGEI